MRRARNLYKSKSLGRIGEGEQFLHSGAYNLRTPPHLATPTYTRHIKTLTPRTSHSPIFNLICENTKTGKKKKKKDFITPKAGQRNQEMVMMTRSATPPRETSRTIRGGFTWKEGNFQKSSLCRLEDLPEAETR